MYEELKKELERLLVNKLKLVQDYRTKKWNCLGDIDLSHCGLSRLPLEFGIIIGDFNCSHNNLTSLIGSPQNCNIFNCNNNNLTTLEGGPQYVLSDMYVHNNRLTSLLGAPKSIGNLFSCINNNLTSLEGLPNGIYTISSRNNLIKLQKPEWLMCEYFFN